MGEVRAAGFLIYRKLSQAIEYLLLQTSYGKNHWTPPKGHVDPGEDDFTTAKRETQEEAGFLETDLNIFKDISYELKYNVRGKPKVVVYWVAELVEPTKNPTLSDEHIAFKWLNKDDAIKLEGNDDFGQMLKELHEKIVK